LEKFMAVLATLSDLIEEQIIGLKPTWALGVGMHLPMWFFDQVRRSRFESIVRYAAEKSSFYRRKFQEAGINPFAVKSPADLKDFFTDSTELQAHAIEEFLCAPAQIAFETTGTSSAGNKKIFFGLHEMESMARYGAIALSHLGVTATDRVVSAFDHSFWVSGPLAREITRLLGCFHVEAGKIEPSEFYDRAADYRFNVILAEPSWLLRLTEVAARRETWPMKLMLVGGENMTEQTRRYIEAVWQADAIMEYGQTESFGGIGVECRQKNGYHLNELNFFFEIDKPDADGYGELVYTTLTRTVMPLIRYRAADITRLIDEPCPCGLPLRRIARIRSRKDEMIVCGMGNVSPWVFEAVLNGITGIGSDWQVRVTRPQLKDRLALHLELTNGINPTEVEETIRQNLRLRFSDFWKNYEMGLYELEFKFAPAGSLRLGRKLLRLVDERRGLVDAH
jgi:phenylacetate-CoA ligase